MSDLVIVDYIPIGHIICSREIFCLAAVLLVLRCKYILHIWLFMWHGSWAGAAVSPVDL